MKLVIVNSNRLAKTSYWFLLVALTVIIGCSRTPSAPTQSAALSLSASSDFVLVSQSIQLSARNPATQELIAVPWQNLTPDIVSIDGNTLTGLRNGQALISAGASSSSQLSIRVIEDFGGWYPGRRFDGSAEVGSAYAVDCTAPNPRWCESNVLEERLGRGPEPFAMHLVQIRDAVTGFVYIRCGTANVTGSVDALGRLSLRGSFDLKGPTCRIEDWSTQLLNNGGALHGRFSFSSPTPGTLVTFEFRGVPRLREASPR